MVKLRVICDICERPLTKDEDGITIRYAEYFLEEAI